MRSCQTQRRRTNPPATVDRARADRTLPDHCPVRGHDAGAILEYVRPTTRSVARFLDRPGQAAPGTAACRHHRSEEHTSELQSRLHLVCRLLLEKKNTHLCQLSTPCG